MGGALAVAAWPKFSCTQIGQEPFFKSAALSSQAERHITWAVWWHHVEHLVVDRPQTRSSRISRRHATMPRGEHLNDKTL
jgi:hypothetical protein